MNTSLTYDIGCIIKISNTPFNYLIMTEVSKWRWECIQFQGTFELEYYIVKFIQVKRTMEKLIFIPTIKRTLVFIVLHYFCKNLVLNDTLLYLLFVHYRNSSNPVHSFIISRYKSCLKVCLSKEINATNPINMTLKYLI